MQKFIISKEGELILGNVEFHFELLGKKLFYWMLGRRFLES